MNRRLAIFMCVSLLLLAPTELLGKGKTVKVVVAGGDLAKSIEISDPNVLANFQVWAGPGTSSNQGPAFIADWSSGAIKELPKGLARYEVSFFVDEPQERIAYVVLYAFDSSTGRGYVYIPGKSDNHYWTNVGSIFRGVEGNWFHAWPLWDRVAVPLITGNRVNQDLPLDFKAERILLAPLCGCSSRKTRFLTGMTSLASAQAT